MAQTAIHHAQAGSEAGTPLADALKVFISYSSADIVQTDAFVETL